VQLPEAEYNRRRGDANADEEEQQDYCILAAPILTPHM
jgi:hypothetical protein